MKKYGKLEMSWHIHLCLNVIIKELTGKSLPFTSPYPLGLSYRYRYCCSIIASTFWRRGKEKEHMFAISMISCSSTALDSGGCNKRALLPLAPLDSIAGGTFPATSS